jgi:hypothetical protein
MNIRIRRSEFVEIVPSGPEKLYTPNVWIFVLDFGLIVTDDLAGPPLNGVPPVARRV